MELAHYREVVAHAPRRRDLIINLTTGPGGRFVPSDDTRASPRPAPP